MKFTCAVLAMVASLAVLAPLTKALPPLEFGRTGDAIADMGLGRSELKIGDPDGWTSVYFNGGDRPDYIHRTSDSDADSD